MTLLGQRSWPQIRRGKATRIGEHLVPLRGLGLE